MKKTVRNIAGVVPAPTAMEHATGWTRRAELSQSYAVARGMGSSRHAANRRRRAREGPEPVRVQTP